MFNTKPSGLTIITTEVSTHKRAGASVANQVIQRVGWVDRTHPEILSYFGVHYRLEIAQPPQTPSPINHLQYEAVTLENAFYHEHHLDPAEWHALSEKFARLDRPFRAAYTLEKHSRLQSTVSA